ncbi:MAG: STAS/SEC14 domain-containing protein [Phycisphaerae bacterium]
MQWEINYFEKEGIIVVKTSGVIEWDDHKTMCQEMRTLADKHGVSKFLADHRDLQDGLSILQIDDLPGMLKEIGTKPNDKIAVIYNKEIENKYRFFQSVAFLASLNFKIFTDEEKAMQWLLTPSDNFNS